MKTLFVLRHGKSSWSDASLDDHDRPLKGRGKKAAKKIGQLLRERGWLPDLVLSSTARRAYATARLALMEAGYEGEIVKVEDLYFASVHKQLAAVSRHARRKDKSVLIVGHNPALEELVGTLTGGEVSMTTANLAVVELDIKDWGKLPGTRGQLRDLVRPRELS
jgi:phosphohistidine phosphatase